MDHRSGYLSAYLFLWQLPKANDVNVVSDTTKSGNDKSLVASLWCVMVRKKSRSIAVDCNTQRINECKCRRVSVVCRWRHRLGRIDNDISVSVNICPCRSVCPSVVLAVRVRWNSFFFFFDCDSHQTIQKNSFLNNSNIETEDCFHLLSQSFVLSIEDINRVNDSLSLSLACTYDRRYKLPTLPYPILWGHHCRLASLDRRRCWCRRRGNQQLLESSSSWSWPWGMSVVVVRFPSVLKQQR